jgi:parvulin-like peptidyl-prolyl isomerase
MASCNRRRRRGLVPVWLALLALIGSGCAQAYGDAYAPVAAVVNGNEIPESELLGTLRLQLDPQTKAALGGEGRAAKYLDAQRSVLSLLVQTEVMVSQARKLGVTVSEGEVSDQLDRIKGRFDSEEKLLATLQIGGLTLERLGGQVRKGLLQDKVAAEVAKGAVPDEELRNVYEQNKHVFDVQFRVAHILICDKRDPASGLCTVESSDDDDLATLLAKRARDGADFAGLARRFSADKGTAGDGGDLGWLSQDRVPANFGTAIAKLQPGGVSDPVRTNLGVHVVKLLQRGRSFEEARDEIEQDIGGERLQKAVNAFLNKTIAASSITVNPRYGRFDHKTQSIVANEPSSR